MEFIIRMKTITRLLLFVAAVLIWLIVLVLVNNAYLYQDDLIIIGTATVLAALTTIGSAKLLRT